MSCADEATECHGGTVYLCSTHYEHAAELVAASALGSEDVTPGLTVESWLDQVNENAAEMGA